MFQGVDQPTVGRRRTRAQAQIEMQQQIEFYKQLREAGRQSVRTAPTPTVSTASERPATACGNERKTAAKRGRGRTRSERASLATSTVFTGPVSSAVVAAPALASNPNQPPSTIETSPVRAKVVIGASFGKDLSIEPTPEKSAPQVSTVASVKPKKNVVRGIAQSSSSSTRKRMISFSPPRDERSVDSVQSRRRLEKNLKTTEKLQQRLDGVSGGGSSTSNQLQITPRKRPPILDHMLVTPPPVARTLQSLSSQATLSTTIELQTAESTTIELTSGEPIDVTDTHAVSIAEEQKEEEDLVAPNSPTIHDNKIEIKSTAIVAVTTDEEAVAPQEEISARTEMEAESELSQDVDLNPTQELGMLSQRSETGDAGVINDKDVYLPASQEMPEIVNVAVTSLVEGHTDDDFSAGFTSTSVIEDVGLFNCETDVEYTGGVYGEGTDGKVSAAVIRGRKVALKRAKPQEGFPEDEAKRRSAIEIHYLRKVRHEEGFLQCLGVCDGIEHTCIALEVMDCKLSDYLRRYGIKSGSSKRRFTLAPDKVKPMLKQICLPMITLHEQVNVAHGDLACRNILLRTPPQGYEQKWEPHVKLSDFGRIKLPSSEPKILDEDFSFYKNCDVGSFGREILFRLLVGEVVPQNCLETRNLHKLLQDVAVKDIPESAKKRLGPYYRLFMRCTAWGVRPTFREIYDHLDDLDYFDLSENGLFPLKPSGPVPLTSSISSEATTFMSPVMESSRNKLPLSSSSRANKFDTPNGTSQRASTPSRLLQSKSVTDGTIATNGSTGANKTTNWLKARSVLSNTHTTKLHPRSLASTSQAFTPGSGRPMLPKKKTPPSAGASRRSLQILNQIQHRTLEKEKKTA